MAVNDFILCSSFKQRSLVDAMTSVGCLLRFRKLYNHYKNSIEVLDRQDFESEMLFLNLQNDNLEKDAKGYYYKTPVRYILHKSRLVTAFFDGTEYISEGIKKRKRLYPGVVALLQCGGIVRFRDKDYCYHDIDKLKKVFKNK